MIEELKCNAKEDKYMIIMSNDSKVQGLGFDSKILFTCHIPYGYTPVYLTDGGGKQIVVCDGDEKHTDAYGRFSFNFYIDTTTGQLTKGTLAY